MSIVSVLIDLDNTFEYEPEGSLYLYEFGFAFTNNCEYVDICTHNKDTNGWSLTGRLIKDGKIFWDKDDRDGMGVLHLTSEVKRYIEKVYNLRYFW